VELGSANLSRHSRANVLAEAASELTNNNIKATDENNIPMIDTIAVIDTTFLLVYFSLNLFPSILLYIQ
jgi:hypothetical protein